MRGGRSQIVGKQSLKETSDRVMLWLDPEVRVVIVVWPDGQQTLVPVEKLHSAIPAPGHEVRVPSGTASTPRHHAPKVEPKVYEPPPDDDEPQVETPKVEAEASADEEPDPSAEEMAKAQVSDEDDEALIARLEKSDQVQRSHYGKKRRRG